MDHRVVAAVLFAAAGAAAADQAEAPSWSGSLTGTQYWLPNEPDFLLGIGIAKHGPLHLEARWQYENLRSVSLFGGWTLSRGNDAVQVEMTPMAGLVFGRTTGVIPGLELNVAWRWLNFYTENEYVFDVNDSSANYFYSWTEVTATPREFLTVGVVGQRTREVHDARDIQYGVLGRLTFRGVTLGVCAFNITTSDWYVTTGITIAR